MLKYDLFSASGCLKISAKQLTADTLVALNIDLNARHLDKSELLLKKLIG